MNGWELQKAVVARLQAYTPITDLVAGVYDHVPQDSAYPYIVAGDDSAIPFDTDNSIGSETDVTIHAWSRYRGRKEIKQVLDAIHAGLHRFALVVANAATVLCTFEGSDSFTEEDGLTRHGVIRFRVILDEL